MKQLTKKQALDFAESGAWRKLGVKERVMFQMGQRLLCMPFDEFHKAIEETLGRPVWTHEFGLNRNGLLAELEGKTKTPTFAEILALLPAEKTIVVVHGKENAS